MLKNTDFTLEDSLKNADSYIDPFLNHTVKSSIPAYQLYIIFSILYNFNRDLYKTCFETQIIHKYIYIDICFLKRL